MSQEEISFKMTVHHSLALLNKTEKRELAKKIWPSSTFSEFDFNENNYAALLEYFESELTTQQRHMSMFAAESLDSTVDLLEHLIENCDKPQSEVIDAISESYKDFDRAKIQRSLELAIRLWLNLHVQSSSIAVGPIPNTRTIEWPNTSSLHQLVDEQFPFPDAPKPSENFRISPSFTMTYLIDVCGLTVSWTNNLADHLLLDRKRRVVTVFQHKICILNHMHSTSTIFPANLLEETIDTFNLLFPFGEDSRTKDFLLSQRRPFYHLGMCGRSRQLDFSNYGYWRERLADLYSVFNEPPQNLRQVVRDRRNMVLWTNSMVAVLAMILGLFGIIFGSVSMVYSVKQYNLGLAQVCADPDLAEKLPQYCRIR